MALRVYYARMARSTMTPFLRGMASYTGAPPSAVGAHHGGGPPVQSKRPASLDSDSPHTDKWLEVSQCTPRCSAVQCSDHNDGSRASVLGVIACVSGREGMCGFHEDTAFTLIPLHEKKKRGGIQKPLPPFASHAYTFFLIPLSHSRLRARSPPWS
jgi:hypothetical protein